MDHYSTYLFYGCIALAVIAVVLLILQRLLRRRTDLLERLLDGIDELEGLLQSTRKKMAAMRSVVSRVPADIAADAQASLDADAPVKQGLKNVLEHRLWIAKHAQTATLAELAAAVKAIDRSRAQIAERLDQLEHAGDELADLTREAQEQQAREPASLRRSGEA